MAPSITESTSDNLFGGRVRWAVGYWLFPTGEGGGECHHALARKAKGQWTSSPRALRGPEPLYCGPLGVRRRAGWAGLARGGGVDVWMGERGRELVQGGRGGSRRWEVVEVMTSHGARIQLATAARLR